MYLAQLGTRGRARFRSRRCLAARNAARPSSTAPSRSPCAVRRRLVCWLPASFAVCCPLVVICWLLLDGSWLLFVGRCCCCCFFVAVSNDCRMSFLLFRTLLLGSRGFWLRAGSPGPPTSVPRPTKAASTSVQSQQKRIGYNPGSFAWDVPLSCAASKAESYLRGVKQHERSCESSAYKCEWCTWRRPPRKAPGRRRSGTVRERKRDSWRTRHRITGSVLMNQIIPSASFKLLNHGSSQPDNALRQFEAPETGSIFPD